MAADLVAPRVHDVLSPKRCRWSSRQRSECVFAGPPTCRPPTIHSCLPPKSRRPRCTSRLLLSEAPPAPWLRAVFAGPCSTSARHRSTTRCTRGAARAAANRHDGAARRRRFRRRRRRRRCRRPTARRRRSRTRRWRTRRGRRRHRRRRRHHRHRLGGRGAGQHRAGRWRGWRRRARGAACRWTPAAARVALPLSFVNDNYRDCADGSDEPGTPACAGVAPAGTGGFSCAARGATSGVARLRRRASATALRLPRRQRRGRRSCANRCAERRRWRRRRTRRARRAHAARRSTWSARLAITCARPPCRPSRCPPSARSAAAASRRRPTASTSTRSAPSTRRRSRRWWPTALALLGQKWSWVSAKEGAWSAGAERRRTLLQRAAAVVHRRAYVRAEGGPRRGVGEGGVHGMARR